MKNPLQRGRTRSRRRLAKKAAVYTIGVVLAGLICLTSVPCQELDSLVLHAVEYAQVKLANSVASVDDSLLFPRATLPDGSWDTQGPSNWTSGFFPGCLWYMYEMTGDTSFRRAAARWTASLESQKLRTNTHDLGFILNCSFGNAQRLNPDENNREVLLQAATSLASRYNSTVGCTRSWDWGSWSFPVIIDNMMNLELLLWASKNGGPAAQGEMAVSHALKTMTNHFRADGSTYHVVDYDPSTGEVVWRGTHQGCADESVWSRGQAWAVYGYTMAYRETGDARLLAVAESAATYFIDHLPPDCVPYWDFLAPDIPDEERDASAAAIACSGLLELSTLSDNPQAAAGYFDSAKEILGALSQPPYLSEGTSSMGILNHGTGNRPGNVEVDVSLIYGDYYFLEALQRYMVLSGLPVTLSRCTAAFAPEEGHVHITWTTLSETNNYGFSVAKDTAGPVGQFTVIPGSFTPGHGTTSIPHEYSFIDTRTRPGRWSYRLSQIDLDGTVSFSEPLDIVVPATTAIHTLSSLSAEVSLEHNYPNPFNPSTTISYDIPTASTVRLSIFNSLGQEVATLADGQHEPGRYATIWDAAGQPSGVYLYRLQAGSSVQTNKMLLVK